MDDFSILRHKHDDYFGWTFSSSVDYIPSLTGQGDKLMVYLFLRTIFCYISTVENNEHECT